MRTAVDGSFCVLLVFVLLADLAAAFCGAKSERRRHFIAPSALPTNDDSILLPIFPLRKKVRLPTESLILNLYEERYLRMAEYILQSDDRIFGALFAAHKPYIVARGTGPVVPMVEAGDIGVLCVLDESEEAAIPTLGGCTTRRRIKLEATAATRFQIHRILHNGYDAEVSNIATKECSPLPFILVEAKVKIDRSDDAAATFPIARSFQERPDNNLVQLASRIASTFAIGRNTEPSIPELQSFAVAAARLPEKACNDRLKCLVGQCTEARLRTFS